MQCYIVMFVMKPLVIKSIILVIFLVIYTANSCLQVQKYPTFRWSDWRPILWDHRYEYQYPVGHSTWMEARDECKRHSAQLLLLETEDEWKGLRRLIAQSEPRTAFTPVYFPLWVGIWREPGEDVWVTDKGEFDFSQSPVQWWSPEHAISAESDMRPDLMRCVYLIMFNTEEKSELGFVNENCSRVHPWVCKRPRT